MKIETVETLVLLLFFAVPGVIFVFNYSRAMPYKGRVDFIRQQFPFEAILLYLTASSLIHSFLFLVFLIFLNLFTWIFQYTDIVSSLITPIINYESATLASFTLSIGILLLYFITSLIIAAYGGAFWRNYFKPSVPIWIQELAELIVHSEKDDEKVKVKLLLKDDSWIEGEWNNIRYFSGTVDSFEISFSQPKRNQVICVDSSNIVELTASWGEESKKVIFIKNN